MNNRAKIFTAFAFSLLSACATGPVRQPDSATDETASKPQTPQASAPSDYTADVDPPLTIVKNGKSLNLVRVMDGGICKNNLQGASGSFLVYADPQDIERIKREQPKEVFKDFESKIQNFSTEVLQQAIDQTNLEIDPFSLGDDVMQEQLAEQLTTNFRRAVARALLDFSRETSLTIDVTPYTPSLIFYQKGCDISRFNP